MAELSERPLAARCGACRRRRASRVLRRLLRRGLALLVRGVLVGVAAARVTTGPRSEGAVVLGRLLRGALTLLVRRVLVGVEGRSRRRGRQRGEGGRERCAREDGGAHGRAE